MTAGTAERWPLLLVGVGLLGLLVAWASQPLVGGDTGTLLAGTETLARCLADGDLRWCSRDDPIDPFPVAQHVPDLAAYALGASRSAREHLLSALSVGGVGLAIASAWIALRRSGSPEWRWGFLLVAVTGPVVAYGGSTWGEMLAAGLLTALVASALVPARPWLVGLAALGAALTKETSYVFVAALGLLGLLLARERSGRPIRRHIVAGAIGLALALVTASALNVVRFGTPRNAYYLDPALRTQTVERFAEVTVGLLVAPNGGMLVFWPTASVLVAALVGLPLVSLLRRRIGWRDAWPALALIAVTAAIVLGLALWWAPFGWWAWGPRLSLPWVLPLVLLALVAYGAWLTPLVSRLLDATWRLVVAAGVVALLTLPDIGLLWRPQTVLEFFFLTETDVCPGGGPPPTPDYYRCLHEWMWLRDPIRVDALGGLDRLGGLATVVAVVLVVSGSLVMLRREMRMRLQERPGPAPEGC